MNGSICEVAVGHLRLAPSVGLMIAVLLSKVGATTFGER